MFCFVERAALPYYPNAPINTQAVLSVSLLFPLFSGQNICFSLFVCVSRARANPPPHCRYIECFQVRMRHSLFALIFIPIIALVALLSLLFPDSFCCSIADGKMPARTWLRRWCEHSVRGSASRTRGCACGWWRRTFYVTFSFSLTLWWY